ncbi:MAG: hypothetical protein Q8N51_00115 [Gammaproteobacteria bacterium]|nr:hypothetical protein [Gammaproteobacteria bacterium]
MALKKREVERESIGLRSAVKISGYLDVLATSGVPAPRQVVVDGLRADQAAAGPDFEADEDIDVQSGRRFEIERGTDSSADGVAGDHAIALHLVDFGQDLLDLHAVHLPVAKGT